MGKDEVPALVRLFLLEIDLHAVSWAALRDARWISAAASAFTLTAARR